MRSLNLRFADQNEAVGAVDATRGAYTQTLATPDNTPLPFSEKCLPLAQIAI